MGYLIDEVKFAEFRARWRTSYADYDIGIDEITAPEIMRDFCEESDGMAEFSLEYTMAEDGEPLWFATVRWEGFCVVDEQSRGSRHNPVDAVLLAIERALDHSDQLGAAVRRSSLEESVRDIVVKQVQQQQLRNGEGLTEVVPRLVRNQRDG